MPYNPTDPVSTIIAGFNARLDVVEAGTPSTPPQITTPAAINSDGTPQVGELLTGVDPIGTNGSVTARRWLLNTTMLTSSQTYTPTAVGAYRFEADFTGTDGSVLVSGSTVSVAAATVIPTLNALSLSSTSFSTAGVTSVGINGKTAGSTITATSSDGTTLTVSGSTLTGTFTAAGSPNITLVETLAGASNTPRSSVIGVSVSATVTLGPLSLSVNTGTVSSPLTATITGKSAGSTLALSGAGAAGLSISGTTVSGTPTTAGTVNIVETLAGATGSPRTSSGVLTISAAVDRIATFGTSVPLLATNKKGGRLQRCTRKTIVFGADVSYITGTFDNYATQPGGDTPVGASLTILQHAYIKPDGTGSKIATFNNGASTTKVLGTDAATGIRVFHDKVYPADIYGAPVIKFTRGDRIMVQTDALVADDQATADMVYNCEVGPIGDSAIEFTATGIPIPVGVGTIPAQTNQATSGTGYTVSCVYGPHTNTAHINFGDSISAGTGDNPISTYRVGYSRAATNSYGLNPVPMLNLARHGTVLNDMINTDLTTKSTGLLRMAYLVPGSFQQVSENWAANDLGQTSSQANLDLTIANKLRLYQILRNRGCQWITNVAPTPRTTNGTTNTPINSSWAKGGQADLLNQWLEARLADGTINGLVRSLALRASSDPTSDSYFIYSNIALALDGTHLNPAGYDVVIPEHRAKVLRNNIAGDEPSFTAGQRILDTFSTGAGASVAARLTDSGAQWIRQGTADLWVTAAGRAYAKQNGYLYFRDPAIGRHQYIEADKVVVASSAAVENLFLRRQNLTDSAVGYNFSYNPSNLTVAISRINTAGTSTVIVSGVAADPGNEYTRRAEANGPYLKYFIGPKGGPLTLVLETIDATFTVGDPGVRENSNATETTGRQYDEVRVGNLVPFNA